MPRGRQRRGIYLLPTVFTVGNLLCGFASLAAAQAGEFRRAAILIILAGVLDGLDGRIARLTGTTSEFGLEFDSLADVVSFGVAPAYLALTWSPMPEGRISLAFLFLVCAATRLARFNIRATAGQDSRRFFAGLPSPAAAGLVAATAFTFPDPPAETWIAVVRTAVVVAAGLLMISRFRYRSFKEFDLKSRRSFTYVLAIAALLVPILAWPEGTLLLLAVLYTLSGPVLYLAGLVSRGRTPGAVDAPEVPDGPTSR
jgi:CDP-diacylglycerol--serine O-phosphatidyltransferase